MQPIPEIPLKPGKEGCKSKNCRISQAATLEQNNESRSSDEYQPIKLGPHEETGAQPPEQHESRSRILLARNNECDSSDCKQGTSDFYLSVAAAV